METPTLIITRGLPGSGKTTWAKAQPGLVRVNRDDLRRMLWGGWTGHPDHEALVTEIQHHAVRVALGAGRDVVCDDTNLAPGRVDGLRAVAEVVGARFEVRDFTDVPLDECRRRNALREGAARVPDSEIMRMWREYLAPTA